MKIKVIAISIGLTLTAFTFCFASIEKIGCKYKDTKNTCNKYQESKYSKCPIMEEKSENFLNSTLTIE